MTTNHWILVTVELADAGNETLETLLAQYDNVGWETLEAAGKTTAKVYFTDEAEAGRFAGESTKRGNTANIQPVERENWQENWREFFQPVQVTPRIRVVPAWRTGERDDGPGAITLIMEPGMAFGTGTHATTQVCMMLLEEMVRPADEMLDAGTGTGILCIVAEKLGAKLAVGYDVDKDITGNAALNRKLNAVNVGSIYYFVGTASHEARGIIIAAPMTQSTASTSPAVPPLFIRTDLRNFFKAPARSEWYSQ